MADMDKWQDIVKRAQIRFAQEQDPVFRPKSQNFNTLEFQQLREKKLSRRSVDPTAAPSLPNNNPTQTAQLAAFLEDQEEEMSEPEEPSATATEELLPAADPFEIAQVETALSIDSSPAEPYPLSAAQLAATLDPDPSNDVSLDSPLPSRLFVESPSWRNSENSAHSAPASTTQTNRVSLLNPQLPTRPRSRTAVSSSSVELDPALTSPPGSPPSSPPCSPPSSPQQTHTPPQNDVFRRPSMNHRPSNANSETAKTEGSSEDTRSRTFALVQRRRMAGRHIKSEMYNQSVLVFQRLVASLPSITPVSVLVIGTPQCGKTTVVVEMFGEAFGLPENITPLNQFVDRRIVRGSPVVIFEATVDNDNESVKTVHTFIEAQQLSACPLHIAYCLVDATKTSVSPVKHLWDRLTVPLSLIALVNKTDLAQSRPEAANELQTNKCLGLCEGSALRRECPGCGLPPARQLKEMDTCSSCGGLLTNTAAHLSVAATLTVGALWMNIPEAESYAIGQSVSISAKVCIAEQVIRYFGQKKPEEGEESDFGIGQLMTVTVRLALLWGLLDGSDCITWGQFGLEKPPGCSTFSNTHSNSTSFVRWHQHVGSSFLDHVTSATSSSTLHVRYTALAIHLCSALMSASVKSAVASKASAIDLPLPDTASITEIERCIESSGVMAAFKQYASPTVAPDSQPLHKMEHPHSPGVYAPLPPTSPPPISSLPSSISTTSISHTPSSGTLSLPLASLKASMPSLSLFSLKNRNDGGEDSMEAPTTPRRFATWFRRIAKSIGVKPVEAVHYGAALTDAPTNENGIPVVVAACIEYLSTPESLHTVGLFRIPGNATEVRQMREAIEAQGRIFTGLGHVTNCHNIAGLLKEYFRELPEPLIPFAQYEMCLSAQRESDDGLPSVEAVLGVLNAMPEPNTRVLGELVRFLGQVASHAAENKMTAKNLAVCFGPDLLRAPEENLTIVMRDMPVVIDWLVSLIDGYELFFL